MWYPEINNVWVLSLTKIINHPFWAPLFMETSIWFPRIFRRKHPASWLASPFEILKWPSLLDDLEITNSASGDLWLASFSAGAMAYELWCRGVWKLTPTHLVHPQYSSFPSPGNEAGEVTEHVLLPKASLKLLDAAEDAAMALMKGWKHRGTSYFRIFFRKPL